MDEKIKKFYTKVEKYGSWKEVPAERVHAIFEEIVSPERIGFVLAKKGLLARVLNGDIRHLIKLHKLKGGSYGLRFGVSLSYMPYPYVPKVKWHRTLKAANLDVRGLDGTRTLNDVLTRCDERLSREKGGVRRLPSAQLVRAVTLARIGRSSEAPLELDGFLSRDEPDKARANLLAALEQITAKQG